MAQRPGDLWAEQTGNTRVVVFRGEHDVSTMGRLTDALADANRSGDGTVLDLSECLFIDSSSLAALFHASRERGAGRFAVVVRPGTEVWSLLDLVAFGEVVPIYQTRDEAIRAVATALAGKGAGEPRRQEAASDDV